MASPSRAIALTARDVAHQTVGSLRTAGRAATALGVVVLFLLTAWTYDHQVAVVYAYEGYLRQPADYAWLLVHLVLAALPVLWLPCRPSRASELALWIIYLFAVVPICAVLPYLPLQQPVVAAGLAAWSVLFLLVASWPLSVNGAQRPPSPFSAGHARFLFTFGGLAVGGLLLVTFGIPESPLSFSSAYARRLTFRTALTQVHPFFGYLVTWVQTVLAPIFLAAAVARRNVVWLGLGGGLLIWGFLVNGSRQVLAMVPLGVLLYYAARRRAGSSSYVWGAAGLLGMSSVGYALTGNALLLGPVAERLYAVPGLLSGYYFDYFSGRAPVLLRDGIGSTLSQSPYPVDMTYLIGEVYLGRPEANANVNVVADAFANFWIAGLVIAAVLGLVLFAVDASTRGLEFGPVALSLTLLLLALVNVGLTVAFTTSGIAVAILIYWLLGEGIMLGRSPKSPPHQERAT